MPRSIVRRGIAFLVMIIRVASLQGWSLSGRGARRCGGRPRRAGAHAERCALDDTHDDRRPAIVVGGRHPARSGERPAGRRYSRPRPSAYARSFSVNVRTKSSRWLSRSCRNPADALETGCRRASDADASIGAPSLTFRHLPSASKFSSEKPKRIHPHVAHGAARVLPVRFETLAHRTALSARAVLLERRHIGRRRRRRRPEHRFEQPPAAQHRRGPVRVRGDRQDAGLTEQAAAHPVCRTITRRKWLPYTSGIR